MPRSTVYLRPAANVSVVLCAALSLIFSRLLAAEAALTRDFNGPDTAWQFSDADHKAQVLSHECVPGGARAKAGVERIVIAAAGGESVHIVCPTTQAAVIDELQVRLWLKATLPGAQLGARIVLPRTSGENETPTTVAVFGANYDRPGHWQQLVLKDLPKLLAAELRVLRLTAGSQADPREAYLDAVVLSVPGDPQGVEIETDDLAVDGVPRIETNDVKLASYPAPGAIRPPANQQVAAPAPATLRRLPNFRQSTPDDAKSDTAELQGELLLVNDKPFSPRAIDWQGEPLEFLSQRGFNVVRLKQPPTTEQSADAKRHGMWFICRPPRPDVVEQSGLGNASDRVAAWHLEDAAIESDPNYARRWAELIRARDAVAGRAVILEPQSDWKSASLTADVLLAGRERCGIIVPADYEHWLADHVQATRPGTPIWAHLATQFDPTVGRQIAALTGAPAPPPSTDNGQLERLAQIACTNGVRGFVFDSHSPLNGSDSVTRRRALALELINRRLQLIEPWLAGGKVIGQIASADANWTGVVLQVDRARLMIPTRSTAEPKAASQETSFVVPGIPESTQVLALTPAAMKTLPTQRIAGGIRVSLKPDDHVYVLMTENPRVIQALRQRVAREGPRYVQLLHDNIASQPAAAIVQPQLRQIQSLLASGGIAQAEQLAVSADDAIQQAAAQQRNQTLQSAVLISNPLMLDGDRLPAFVTFQTTLSAMARGDNVLYGGDFEDLGQMTQLGWQHFRNQVNGVETRAELTNVEPRHGSACLLLQNEATGGGTATTIDSAPVWIQSPPIPIADAGWLEITGWVRIDYSITGSNDGLQIVDSLGGPDLAIAVRSTPGWQRFQMIRAATEPTEVRLTFALAGIGSARIDAVMIRPLEPPTQPAPIAGAGPLLNVRPVQSSGPLLVAPRAP